MRDFKSDNQPFSVTVRGITIDAVLSGLWSLAIYNDFETLMAQSEEHFRRLKTKYVCMCDLRDFPVQTGEVAAKFQIYLGSPRPFAAKTAIVTQGGLKQLQAQRVAKGAVRRFFLNFDEAKDWLSADIET